MERNMLPRSPSNTGDRNAGNSEGLHFALALMAYNNKPKKIGGEVGEVRANIDADKLNEYIARHVKAIQAPVSIKQFKVSARPSTSMRFI